MNQRYPLTRTWSLMAICALLLFGPLSPERALAANGYTIVDLGVLPGTPSSGNSSARGINNAGVVVGISTPAPPPCPERFITGALSHHAFRWTPETGMQDLGANTDGPCDSRAFAISNAGFAVGMSSEPGFNARGAFWSPGSLAPVSLGLPPACGAQTPGRRLVGPES